MSTAPWNTLVFPWSVVESLFTYWSGYWERALTGSVPSYRRKQSSFRLTKKRLALFRRLMHSVKPTGITGEYLGAPMNLRRTTHWATASGDGNDVHLNPKNPHPLFGELIAHGMDAATSGLIALKLELHSTGLVPFRTEIEFRNPVLLKENAIPQIQISIPEGQPLERIIEVFAGTTKEEIPKPKRVVKMRVHLKKSALTDRDWLHTIVAGWRISALLAETWPRCLYFQQVLDFEPTPHSVPHVTTHVRGRGLNPEKRCTVHTTVHHPKGHRPLATGHALIIPHENK